MEKRGVSQLMAIVLLIILVVVISMIIFTFVSRTYTQETAKSADRASAQEICRERVKIRINDIRAEESVEGSKLKIDVENLKGQDITDFVIRLEQGGSVDITTVKQILGGYEKTALIIDKKFSPSVVKVIPKITLKKPDITSMTEGWWLCSDQMAVYNM